MSTLGLTQRDYKRFQDLVLERSGLYFPESRREALCKGLAEALETSSCTNLDEYHQVLWQSPSTSAEWDRLVSALTVGETYFFRNKAQFDALAEYILPEIIAQREQTSRRIRIWSAGCASGEEPYSIAILLRELIPDLETWELLILATDINRDALRKARTGTYGYWSFRGIEKRIRDRHFRPCGKRKFAISDEIKRLVTFRYLNLMGDTYPSISSNTAAMDVILCRNVTIYFSPEVTQKAIDKLHRCLVDGGWLVTGASEPNMVFYQGFQPKTFFRATIYQKPAAGESTESTPGDPATTLQAMCPVPASRDVYEEAIGSLKAGLVDEAIAKLHEKLEQDPEFAPAYHTLGKIYAERGNLEEAHRWCEEAVSREKLDPEPYYTLSTIYRRYGLLDMAMEALRKAIYLDREFVLAHYDLAQIHQQQGKNRLAHKSLRNVQRLLAGKPRQEPIPGGQGMMVGRLLQLVETALQDQGELQ